MEINKLFQIDDHLHTVFVSMSMQTEMTAVDVWLKVSAVQMAYETKLPGAKFDAFKILLDMNELEVATADTPIPTVLKLHI